MESVVSADGKPYRAKQVVFETTPRATGYFLWSAGSLWLKMPHHLEWFDPKTQQR
jgi:hypothetical protein